MFLLLGGNDTVPISIQSGAGMSHLSAVAVVLFLNARSTTNTRIIKL